MGVARTINANYISIHALREEGDGLQPRDRTDGYDFYPRPPRGGRLSTSPMVLRP